MSYFINGLHDKVPSKIQIFADDTNIYRTVYAIIGRRRNQVATMVHKDGNLN